MAKVQLSSEQVALSPNEWRSRGTRQKRRAPQLYVEKTMPELSRFLGIVIGMFCNEHGVARFHAVYGEHEISDEVEPGTVHGHFLA